MAPEEADSYEVGRSIHLLGYTSTSKHFQTALGFAQNGGNSDSLIPVVFEITFLKKTGFVEVTPEYSAYPLEQEVLVQDGLEYLITSNSEEETQNKDQKFRLIKLKYPPISSPSK